MFMDACQTWHLDAAHIAYMGKSKVVFRDAGEEEILGMKPPKARLVAAEACCTGDTWQWRVG